jgi:hypothetical protein
MNKLIFTTATVCGLTFLGGCLGDPVARTAYSVSPVSIGVPRSQVEQTTDQIVQTVAQAHGLNLVEKRVEENGRLRDKTYLRLTEHNPDLWMTIRFGEHSLRVDINEHYISRPTGKHRQLVSDLKDRLEQAGLQATRVDK